jgi:hypothetical protein
VSLTLNSSLTLVHIQFNLVSTIVLYSRGTDNAGNSVLLLRRAYHTENTALARNCVYRAFA